MVGYIRVRTAKPLQIFFLKNRFAQIEALVVLL